jgi:GalNAc-alpha-(1->4)-GalNAc-alpha-(1->3)-diNAcBac-PP-undecaprenol alpha-1,4-N-acetyl-D-galactosaminyltransferase
LAKVSVVLVIGDLRCGGAQRVLVDMANYWAGLDWDVSLATWNGAAEQDFYDLDSRIERVELSGHSAVATGSRLGTLRSLVAGIRSLRRLVVEKRASAVLSFIDVSNVLTILASALLGVRVVVSERTNPGQNHTISSLWKFLRRLTYCKAAMVVAQTKDAALWLNANCKVQALVIPNSIRQMPKVEVVRESTVLAVGRLSPEKGIDTLLRGFALVKKKASGWRVIVVGDGPARADLIALRDELNLTDSVEFIGEVHDVEKWLACAGLFVHASRREGYPNVLLEAMAMGAPVISTDCRSGPSDLIRDDVNGRLVAVDDIGALANAMTQLIEKPELRARLSTEALNVRRLHEQSLIMKYWNAALLGHPVV